MKSLQIKRNQKEVCW